MPVGCFKCIHTLPVAGASVLFSFVGPRVVGPGVGCGNAVVVDVIPAVVWMGAGLGVFCRNLFLPRFCFLFSFLAFLICLFCWRDLLAWWCCCSTSDLNGRRSGIWDVCGLDGGGLVSSVDVTGGVVSTHASSMCIGGVVSSLTLREAESAAVMSAWEWKNVEFHSGGR